MRLFPLLLYTGLVGLLVYGASKTMNIARLNYLLQTVKLDATQMAMLIVIANPFTEEFSQDSINADVYVNGNLVSHIQDATPIKISAGALTPQGWLIPLDKSKYCADGLKLVRVAGYVTVSGVETTLDIRYKLI
jgi:hypothetical protein